MQRFVLPLLVPVLCAPSAVALQAGDLRVAAVFTGHMAFQRGTPVSFWGSADAGKLVVVEFAGHKNTAAPDTSGRWNVQLDPFSASGESRELIVSAPGEPPLLLGDALVGEA